MAFGAQPLTLPTWRSRWAGTIPGLAVIALLLAVLAAGLWALLSVATPARTLRLDAYVGGVVAFSLLQGTLSAVLSVGLAVPVARALFRRGDFPLRTLLVRLMGLPMVVPTIVGVIAIVVLFGRQGWLNQAWGALGLGGRIDIYGLHGILLAHLFFNLPFAARLILSGLATIPQAQWRQASQLGLSGWQVLRWIEYPVLREVIPGILGIVFLLCFTSFAIVLALGGGPPNATLEVAIYQALRFEFDVTRAALLAGIQLLLCLGAYAAILALGRPVESDLAATAAVRRPDADAITARIVDTVAIGLALLLLLGPLLALASRIAGGPLVDVLASGDLWAATARSLAVGTAAGLLSLVAGWGILTAARALRQVHGRPGLARAAELAGSMILVVPPMVLGAGLFLAVRGWIDPFAAGLLLVVLVNAGMGLPFMIRILGPALDRAGRRYGRLSESLGLRRWHRLVYADWPEGRASAGLALALVICLSFGDFGVIALFGSSDTATLPFLLYERMGAYRMDEAAVIAGWLLALCVLLFVAVERLVGGRERA